MTQETLDPPASSDLRSREPRTSKLLDRLRKVFHSWLKNRPGWSVTILVAVYAVSFVPIALLFKRDIPWTLGLIITAFPIAAAWLMSVALTRVFLGRTDYPKAARLFSIIGIIASLGIAAVVFAVVNDWPTRGFGFAAFITSVVVVGGFVTWLRHALASRKIFAWGVLLLTGLVALTGFILPPSTLSFWLLVAGTLLMPVGVAVVSEVILPDRPQRSNNLAPPIISPKRWWWWTTGIAVLVGGSLLIALWLKNSLPNVHLILLLVVVAAAIELIMLLVAADNIVGLLLVALIVSFVAFYQNSEAITKAPVSGNDGRILVALGDSYMSGEGAGDFYPGTNDKGANECRRSEHAYAELMAANYLPAPARFDDVISLACSGATIEQVTTIEQFPGIGSQLDQLDDLIDSNLAPRVELVIISLGGNDAGFGDIGQACIIPGSCVEKMQDAMRNIAEVKQELLGAYYEIRNRLVEMKITAPVLVIPYPVPIAEVGCTWSAELFSADEHKFLYNFANALDTAIREAAEVSEFYVLDDMAAVFVGDNRLAICSRDLETDRAKNLDELGVNFIKLGSVSGSPGQIADPRNWIHNSLHPTIDGHLALRDALAIWLNNNQQLKTLTSTNGEPPAPPDGIAKLDTSDWMYASLAAFLRSHLVYLYFAALGGWLVALALITRHRRWRLTRPGWLEWQLVWLGR